MTIEISENTYNKIIKEANKYNADATQYLKDLMDEVTEIIPTKEEKKEWKQNLYHSLSILCEYYAEIIPTKRDSLATLLDKFFWWASEKNDGYFSERDEADTDRYCAWLVQEYENYA